MIFKIPTNIVLFFLVFLIQACSHSTFETETTPKGVLKELYNDHYYSLVTEKNIRIEPVSRDWKGYRHVDTEPEKVSFLVRAALVEVNNTCGADKRPRVSGKPKILRFKNKPELGPIGVEVEYKCLKR
ncbi:MAG: hypothetical protein ACOYL6_06050 [Bacteriovoracaceae bacterium]